MRTKINNHVLRNRGGKTFQRARGGRPGRKPSGSETCGRTAAPSTRLRPTAFGAEFSPHHPASVGGKVISRACPREPRASFCIPRTQINQPAPYPEMAILPRNLHICILPFFPEFNFLQELILITLFKQRGFGVYTNMTFFFFSRGTHRIFCFLSVFLSGLLHSV